MELLQRIRRRCLAVGWATVAVAVWHLLTNFFWGRVPGWRPLFTVYCLGSILILFLSGGQLRKARRNRVEIAETLKTVEDDCWAIAALCAVIGGWFAVKLLFRFGDPDDMMAGFLGGIIGITFRTSWKLTRSLRAQEHPETSA